MEAGADWVWERGSSEEVGPGMYTAGRRPRKGPELKLLFFLINFYFSITVHIKYYFMLVSCV